MSFGQELKEFAAGFGTGAKIGEGISRTKYYDALTKKAEGDTFDIKQAAQDDPNYDGSMGEKPHGLLYNLGNWLGLNDHEKPKTARSALDATQAQSAVPLDSYEAQYAPDTDGYTAGYSAGGVVIDPEDPDQAAAIAAAPSNSTPGRMAGDPEPTPPPMRPADDAGIPDEKVTSVAQAVPAEQVVSRPTPDAPGDMAAVDSPETDGAGKSTLSDALHGGINAIQANLGLKHQGVPDQETMAAGQQRLLAGDGRASHEEMKAVAKAVDPKGELSHSQMMLRAMTKGYEFYMERGMPDKANNYAASIIQYATFEASKHGEDAIQAIQKGDLPGAAKSLAAGYSNIPDGKEATGVKVNLDKTVTVTETDVATGKPITQHTLTGMQLYQAAIGLANKSESWKAIMSAAAAAKGVNLPPSDAYNSAVDRLNGVNSDGTVTQPGNAPPAAYQPQGGGAAPPAQAAPQGQPQQSAPNDYLKMMAAGESSNRPGAKNGDSVGLYQIQTDAWRQITGHDPIVNGVDERLDPKKNTMVMQALTQANAQQFQQAAGRAPSPAELAVMHQQGATGGMKLMLAAQKAPNTPAASIVGNPRKLTLNGIPENATAAQAVQHIQQYYMSKGSAAGPAGAAPGAPQPGQSLALRPALSEDQVEKPTIPERPVTPEQVRVTSKDTEGMSGPERVAYTRQVAEMNKQRQKKFSEDMQLYNSAVSQAKAAGKAGKDKFSLPVKDRNDAMTALKEARPDPADATDPAAAALAKFQPQTQKAVDDVAYGLYTHNDTTPQRAYQAAISMMIPNSMNFTPHETSDPGMVKIVFRSGDTMTMPKNSFDQLAAARGNEHYVMRTGAEDAARKSGENAELGQKAGKAGKAALNIAGKAADAGKTALGVVDRGIGQALTDPVKTGRKVVSKVGRGILSAVDEGFVNQR